jgi:hypothetical protein
MSAFAALAAGLVTGLLVYFEPRLPSDKKERAIIASAWLGTAVVVVALWEEWAQWGVAAAFAAVTVGTGGRPALVMDRIIELDVDEDGPLRRRRTMGLIALVVVAAIVAAVTTDW